MSFSLKNFFFEKVLGMEKQPSSLDRVMTRAENMEIELIDEMAYIREKQAKHDSIFGDQTGFAVECANAYLQQLERNAMILAGDLRDFVEDTKDTEIHARLKGVADTFEEAQELFTGFIQKESLRPYAAPKPIQVGYLANVVKMFEPDLRPRAPVIPIRQEFDFEG